MTITKEFSKFLTSSKRSPVDLKSEKAAEIFNSTFQNFIEVKKIHQYSRFTDKRPIMAERVIRALRTLLKKPVFEKWNADWLSEVPSVIKK